jgi:superfamily II DNA/RNA helicase
VSTFISYESQRPVFAPRIGRMKISSIQAVVFDEFDALLEYKPHRDPTAAIMSALKRRHRDSLQSILCSATASDMAGSTKLSNYLRPGFFTAMADKDDQLITVGDDKNAVIRVSRTVIHGVVHVPRRQLALATIRKILHTEPIPQQVLIFADNARRVDLVVEKVRFVTAQGCRSIPSFLLVPPLACSTRYCSSSSTRWNK